MRRAYHWGKLSACWVVVLSAAILAMAVGFGLRPHRLVLVPAIVVTGLALVAYFGPDLIRDAGLTMSSWRWWLWFRKAGKTLALRDKRRSSGRCPSCAYDLTGNLSGVCPECGEANV